MNKVVAFLEEYAQWVALGIASLFFLYVVYAYVLVGDQLKVTVGNEPVNPEAVDTKINDLVTNRLVPATETPAAGLDLHVKDFADEFTRRMGSERLDKEALASTSAVRPPIPGVDFQPTSTPNEKVVIAALPEVPKPKITDTITGNSLVAAPPPLPEEGQDDTAQPVDTSQQDPDALLASALDKKWIMGEGKVDVKDLAAAWKNTFFKNGKPLPVPPQAMLTNFLQLEVVREEQTGPETWGNAVTLKPLPLIRTPDYPKQGDREGEERYRQWAETHQVDIVEPAFYRVLKGDPWYIPSMGAPKDPNLAEATTDQPFDPANPNIPFEKMTSEQKQMVYKYKQEKKAEEQKAKAAERRSQTQAAESSRRSGGSGGGGGGGDRGGGGRRIGGYAPLPIQLAAGPGSEDQGGRTPPPGRTPVRPGVGRSDPGRGDPGRGAVDPRSRGRIIPAPGANVDPRSRGRVIPGRDAYNRADAYTDYGRGAYGRGDAGRGASMTPQLNPDGMVQNQILTGPFDPTKIPLDLKGANSDILVWFYDDNVESGKTYRYKMRIKLKNPLYNTYGLTAKPDDSTKFALVSDWSDWKTVTAPKTTEYFFTAMRQQLGAKNVITSVTASVYRHAKGEWTKQTFTVAPGDAIGGVKDGVDYSTGATLVDLRPDTRERDLRILVSDNVGNVTTVNYQEQLNNEYLKSLEDKVNKPVAPGDGTDPAAATDGTRAGNRALVNEVGGLR